jgi:ATP-dependent helicase/nuclease subunit A
MTPDPPPDHAARERAATDLDHNLVVTAGAGTGKTTLLVRRALAAIKAGTAVDRIVAITFTEKAAAELRWKLRAAIEKAAGREPDERWEEALRNLDRAPVTTIHAFAGSLLREFPLEAGIDPGARVVDAVQAAWLLRSAWNRFLRDELLEPEEGWLRVLEVGGPDSLWELARKAADNRDILRLGPDPGSRSDYLLALWEGLEPRLGELRELAPRCSGARDAVGSRARKILAFADEAGDDPETLVTLLAGAGKLPDRTKGGTAKRWEDDPALLERARTAVNAAAEQLAGLAKLPDLAARHEATVLALERLDRFFGMYQEEKRRAGALDFQDLLLGARDLLRDRLDVRRILAERYRHLLVDEFQDTDPLQAEIVLYLCDRDCRERDWRRVRLEPGKLFLVGDPKQAIYGWRRADMTVYREVAGLVQEQGGGEEALTANFRSAGAPIELVNGLFARLMREEEDGRIQPAYAGIDRARALEDPDGPLVHLLGVTATGLDVERLTRDPCEEAETRAVAALMREAEGSLEVAGSDGGVRPARWSDIALLARTNDTLRAFERALQEEAIPYVVVGGRGFFARAEVADLVLLMKTLVHPEDRLSLAGTLRSPLFAMTDADLHRLHRAGRLEYLGQGPEEVLEDADLDGRWREACAALHRWHGLARRAPAAELLENVLEESDLAGAAAVGPDGEQRFANLRKMVETAEAYCPTGDPTVAGFLSFLEEMEGELPEEGESPLAEEGGDAVRLMTIHKAKGLEYPVLFLVALHAGTGGGDRDLLVGRRPGGEPPRLGIRHGPWLTLAHPAHLKDWEERRRKAESLRLLYVAMTRARDHLFLSGGFTGRLEGSILGEICAYLGLEDGDFTSGPGEGPLGGRTIQSAGLAVTLHATGPVEPAGPTRRRPVSEVAAAPPPEPDPLEEALEAAARRAKEAAEARARILEAPATWFDERETAASGEIGAANGVPGPLNGAKSAANGRNLALRTGSAVHHVLERLEPGKQEGWREILDGALAGLPADERKGVEERAAELLQRLFASEVWKGLSAAGRSWNEVPLVVRMDDGVIARGRADLVLEQEDGSLEVVDWKTDALAGRPAAEAAKEHTHQARIYTRALEKATGRPVARFTFVYMEPCEAVTLA